MAKSELFLLLVFASLPIQLNKFFWPKYSFVLGIPIDIQAIGIYLIDVFIVLYILFFFFENFTKFKKIYFSNKNFILPLIIFNLYLLFNSIFISEIKPAAYYFNLKLLEFSVLALFAQVTLSNSKFFRKSLLVITFSLIWQSFLVMFQFILQRSLGFWFLGERTFNSSTIAIAHGQLGTLTFLRPYGTFPHPNVVGAFFTISLLILLPFINLLPQTSSLRIKNRTYTTSLKFLILFCGLAGILLSFSKGAIASLIIGYFFIREDLKSFIAKVLIFGLLLFFFLKILPQSQIPSIAERLMLSQAAFDIVLKNPLFGVGSHNFIPQLATLDLTSLSQVRLLQPVHNVFLLILAENGIIGLLLFTLLLFIVLKQATSKFKIALFISILIFALVDHFLWTLEQGQLLFWLTVSYILSKPKEIPLDV